MMRGDRTGYRLQGHGSLSSLLFQVLLICHLDLGVTGDISLLCANFRLQCPGYLYILFVNWFLSALLVAMGARQTATWSLGILGYSFSEMG